MEEIKIGWEGRDQNTERNCMLPCIKVALQFAFKVIYVPSTPQNAVVRTMLVSQSYLTLCDPTDGSQPGSSVHGIL